MGAVSLSIGGYAVKRPESPETAAARDDASPGLAAWRDRHERAGCVAMTAGGAWYIEHDEDACPDAGGKSRRSDGRRRRKLRPDDIGGMLVEVGKAAAQDPRLTDVDRDVYYAMLGRAHGLTETEITATRRWLETVTSHPYWKCRRALQRLDRFGYLTRITRDEVKRQKLLNWLASHTFDDGRLPGIYRMSLNPPRWDDVPDFMAPLDPDWRDRVDALLAD